MAVAFASSGYGPTTAGNYISFSYNNAGNALCAIGKCNYNSYVLGNISLYYASQALSIAFATADESADYINWTGGYKLNAASGANTFEAICDQSQDSIAVFVISVSGASTSMISGSASRVDVVSIPSAGTYTSPSLSVASQATDLVIKFADINQFNSTDVVTAMNSGTLLTSPTLTPTKPFWSASYAGASPTQSSTINYYIDGGGYGIPFQAAFSFPIPSASVATKNKIIGPQVSVWNNSYLR